MLYFRYIICSLRLYNVSVYVSSSTFIGPHNGKRVFFSLPSHLQHPPTPPQSVKMEPLCHMASKQACAGLIIPCPPSAPTLDHAKATERGGRASKPPPIPQRSALQKPI